MSASPPPAARASRRADAPGATIPAAKHGPRLIPNPPLDLVLAAGDQLMVMGSRSARRAIECRA